MIALTHKRATVNGVTLHYVTVGNGPVVLCMHGWPQNHREFLPVIEGFADQFTFIAPDLRGFADSDKPYDGCEPKTIAKDMLALLAAESVEKFHILSHDLGGPPSVALAGLRPRRVAGHDRDALLRPELPGLRRSARVLLASRDAHEYGHHAFSDRGPGGAVPSALLS
jgi:pimeloyl-ACP methyl ester carboxylesterase